jgi:hypothetical protein
MDDVGMVKSAGVNLNKGKMMFNESEGSVFLNLYG